MPLLLPNLDDRTWSDLVAEGTSLIPVYGPEWTNQNYSDPGITLVELLGYLAESCIYQTNQISDRERLRFLALVGVAPKPPVPAYAILSFKVADGVPRQRCPSPYPQDWNSRAWTPSAYRRRTAFPSRYAGARRCHRAAGGRRFRLSRPDDLMAPPRGGESVRQRAPARYGVLHRPYGGVAS